VISKVNDFPIILIYALTSCTLTIDMKKMIDNKYFFIRFIKNIIYDMKLKWIILIDIMLMIMCVLEKKVLYIRNRRNGQVKLNLF